MGKEMWLSSLGAFLGVLCAVMFLVFSLFRRRIKRRIMQRWWNASCQSNNVVLKAKALGWYI